MNVSRKWIVGQHFATVHNRSVRPLYLAVVKLFPGFGNAEYAE